MAASWENDSALKAANEQVAAGQNSGNKDQVAAGTKAQDAALANHGIVVYRGGNTSQTPTSQSTGGAAPTTGSGSGSAGSGASGTEPTLSEKVAALDAQREAKIAKNKSKNSNPASAMYGNAAQIYSSAQQQQKQQIDYAVNQGVKELQRAEEDAQKQFQTQQNQVDIDEAKALDNQALYAEARGDRGGIGQAQYGQIQATAMTNRRAINTARTELATNTARQIADLRAQGEFQKADAILQLTQNYLSQLNEIQMWEAEYNLTVEQMNEQIRQWNESFAVEVANLTGTYNGQKTRAAREAEAEIALGMLQEGYTLSEEQLANLLSVYNISGATAESIRTEAQAAKDKEKDAELVNIALTYAQNGIDLTEAQWAALERAGHSRAQVEQIIQAAKDAKKPKSTTAPTTTTVEPKSSIFGQLYAAGKFTKEAVVDWLLSYGGYDDPADAAALFEEYYKPWLSSLDDVQQKSNPVDMGAGYDSVMRAVGHYLNVKDPKSKLAGITDWLKQQNPQLTTAGWDRVFTFIEQKTGVPMSQW